MDDIKALKSKLKDISLNYTFDDRYAIADALEYIELLEERIAIMSEGKDDETL